MATQGLPLPPIPSLPMSTPVVIESHGFQISKDQLTVLVPVAVAATVGGFLVSRYFTGRKKSQVNTCVCKDSAKVVHSFDIEDIGSKAVYCRCWRSKKFPYCDGSHTKHNEITGDNPTSLSPSRPSYQIIIQHHSVTCHIHQSQTITRHIHPEVVQMKQHSCSDRLHTTHSQNPKEMLHDMICVLEARVINVIEPLVLMVLTTR
uniref:CDGSH iron-sulfur domain-containing protein 2 n=1 Tax=Salmo trutta TaxID=8032 RepID=A0A673W7U9_SALTR